jgi:type I restriction enzyme, S subunit
MMTGWDKITIGDIIVENPKSKLKVRDSISRGKFPFYTSGISITSFDNYICDGRNIFIATGGKACIQYYEGKSAYSTDCYSITTRDSVIPKFLFHFLSSSLPLIEEQMFEGAALRHLQKAKFRDIVMPLPSRPEQQLIVNILDEAFDCIATAKANTENNIQNSRELFQCSLNAAITGELTREWRSHRQDTKSAAEQLKLTLNRRRTEWKGTGKYVEPQSPVVNEPIDIPSSWVLSSPEQLSTHIIDCPHSTPKWVESGEVCLRTTNFKPGYLNLESVQFVSEKTYNERIMRLEPKPGDVLYSREGGILGIACIFPDGFKACLGQRMMQFRLDSDIVLPQYFTAVLNSPLILSEVKRLTGGAAAPHLNIRDIRAFPISLPPILEQYEIINKLEVISAETRRLESIYLQKLTALDALKKSLLDQAFSGQL